MGYMGTKVKKYKQAGPEQGKGEFAFCGVKGMKREMERVERGYVKLQFTGSRQGKVVRVVALSGEVK